MSRRFCDRTALLQHPPRRQLHEPIMCQQQNSNTLPCRYEFDVAYTSVLRRAIRTLWLSQAAMGNEWLPTHKDWRLNERHYGALTGLNKAETVEQYGEEQVTQWRRSYDVPPPALDEDS